MILKHATKRYAHGELVSKDYFAWYPVKMKQSSTDEDGEIIWLEKYRETHKRDTHSTLVPWDFVSRVRLAQIFLNQLEKDVY